MRTVLNLRVRNLIAVVEHDGLAEDHIVAAHLVIVVYILPAIEPNQVANAAPVAEMGNDPTLPRSECCLLEAQYPAADLHERHIRTNLCDAVDATPVHIFIWIILQQITIGADSEFLTQNLFAPRSHARQIHYVLFGDGSHVLFL